MYYIIGVFNKRKVQIVEYVIVTGETFVHTKMDFYATKYDKQSEAIRVINKLNASPYKPSGIEYIITTRMKN